RKKFSGALLRQIDMAMTLMSKEVAMAGEIAPQFLVNGLLGVIEWWIGNNMPCSAEEITGKLLAFLKPFTDYIP
ncbi:MAG: TetR family transcriptional regulator C-terminal domain-containing protein, partial [Lachnospiraceae bacterium]|nr:TetR family transcriptional regulator C-terminal domain-containing protein [Lachnospiraceae bacterium]